MARQRLKSILPPLLLLMNGHSPKLITPPVTPTLSSYLPSLPISRLQTADPVCDGHPPNICPVGKLGLVKDLGKVIWAVPSKSGTITLLKLLYHLAAASACASCDINPTVAAVWRGHVFGAYQCSLCRGVISSADREKVLRAFLSPEKWIYGINVV